MTNNRPQNVVKANKEVIGVKVANENNEDLGEVYEIMLDKVSGQVAYIVLQTGTFLGLGGKLIALPWNAIHYNDEDKCFILNVDKEKIKNAPGFDEDNWPDMSDRQWGESTSRYYGAKSYWE